MVTARPEGPQRGRKLPSGISDDRSARTLTCCSRRKDLKTWRATMRGGLAAEDWSTFPPRNALLALVCRLVRQRRDPDGLQDRLDDRKIDPFLEGYLPQVL